MRNGVQLSTEQWNKLKSKIEADFWAIKHDFIAVNIPTSAGSTGDFVVPDKNILHKAALVIGLSTRVQNAAGQKFCENELKLVNLGVHHSSFLALKDRNKRDVIENMPLEVLEIRQADNPMLRRYIDFVDLANSKIVCKNTSALVDDESYELQVWYLTYDELMNMLDEERCY